ncbi:probable phosphomevalonate kinase [Teleopsis dalmanni]|uniref:probable phosphomevalonate kinase n=1 Tax=Teleopsis dalmanni TaxID=139649 RepID=UPI0018CF38AC|nr:probable phosphomevalonate kinase [Teleopsis dalmanni]
MSPINHIILISGKRKCGKDFLSEKLQKRLGERSQIIRISEPIKSEWAKKRNLNLEELLSDGPYKEQYRKEMIVWSDEMREKDYGYFCRAAMSKANHDVVIVSDIRRKNDIKYFRETYGACVQTIRLTCPEAIRFERGWSFTSGIDDVASECDLDEYDQWDLIIENNNELNGEQIIDLIMTKFDFD